MLLVGFEPMISAGEGPQTYVLDRAATGIGNCHKLTSQNVRLYRAAVILNSLCVISDVIISNE